MKRWKRIIQFALLAAVAAGPISILRAQSGRSRSSSSDKYRLLSENNIFLRVRRRPVRRTYTPRPRTPAPPPDPDRYIKLTGTALQGSESLAFLEDSRREKTLRIRVGDEVGKGKVIAITSSGIEYQRDEKISEIKIGYTLSGSTEASRSSSSYSRSSYTPRSSSSRSPSSSKTPSSTETAKAEPAETESTETEPTETEPAAEPSSRPAETETKSTGAGSLLERMRKRRQQELEK